jgi:dipeptidase E
MRRMLLTSAGLHNDAQKAALADLLGTRFGAARVVFIPAAAAATSGDHGWLIEDINRVHGLGWKEFNILELGGLPLELILDRIRRADVIYVEGGNHYHLANSIRESGLAAELPEILEEKVYVGVSAGSMIFCKPLSQETGEVFGEQDDLRILHDPLLQARPALGLFDWYLKPHMHSRSNPERTPSWYKRAAEQLDFPIFALDDNSAVRVFGNEIDVVSTGNWLLLDPNLDPSREPVALAATTSAPVVRHSWRQTTAELRLRWR